MFRPVFFIILLFISYLCACDKPATVNDEETPLARVYSHNLYPSDLKGLVKPDATLADSALIVNDHVQSWIRDRLFAHAAENNLPDDINIDRLVDNYRASLMLNTYKQELLKQELDTTVTMQELQSYYDENKEKYRLQENIAQCYYIKVKRDANRVGDLKRWWTLKKESYHKNLVNYAQKNALEHNMLDSLGWTALPDLEAKLPGDSFKDKYYKNGDRDIYVKDRKHRYFLRLNKVLAKGGAAPLGYVQDDIAKIILKRKKKQLIEKKQEELYQKELDNKNIEIF